MTGDFSTHEYNKLILIPAPLGAFSGRYFESPYHLEILKNTRFWIAESARSLRRFLSSCKLGIEIDQLEITELGYETPLATVLHFLENSIKSGAVGLISDAGMPALADPGAAVVAHAHKKGIKIEIIPGPSSMIMALCGSGFNGQGFTFHGYSPVKTEQLVPFLKKLPQVLAATGQTQLWMETPYRTDRMLDLCRQHLPANLFLSVAADLHGENEQIVTRSVANWKAETTELGKVPAVFSIGHLQ